MDEILRIHDKFFKDVFKNEENTRALLRNSLPSALNSRIDYSFFSIDTSNHISPQFDEGFSDLVAKTRIKTASGDFQFLDVYILIEHKSYLDNAVFIQLLWYMVSMWQEDLKNKVPLRVIIPIVFYHGESKWTIPVSFVDKFDVDEEVKKYLLDFQYTLFDTTQIDLWDERHAGLRENLYFFTSVAVMKYAVIQDWEGIRSLFRLWYEKGFIMELEIIQFTLKYIAKTCKVEPEKLKTLLDESHLDGGAIMETLYTEIHSKGMQEGKQESAQNALKEGLSDETISRIFGFTLEEVRAFRNAKYTDKKFQTTN